MAVAKTGRRCVTWRVGPVRVAVLPPVCGTVLLQSVQCNSQVMPYSVSILSILSICIFCLYVYFVWSIVTHAGYPHWLLCTPRRQRYRITYIPPDSAAGTLVLAPAPDWPVGSPTPSAPDRVGECGNESSSSWCYSFPNGNCHGWPLPWLGNRLDEIGSQLPEYGWRVNRAIHREEQSTRYL